MSFRALLACLAALLLLPAAAPAAGVPARWDKGFNVTSWWHDGYASQSARQALTDVRATGANSVAVIVTWYQDGPRASAVAPDAEKTPTDEAIASAVREARARGLRVMLRLMVDPRQGSSAVNIAATDPQAWFASYETMVRRYAALAQEHGVRTLALGVELKQMTTPVHEARWRALVRTARGIFRGRLTYSANWDEYRHIRWWRAVDAIGIDAYFPLSTGRMPAERTLVRRWSRFVDASGRTHRYRRDIAAVSRRHRRPVIFTELGYASGPSPLVEPWLLGETYTARPQQVALSAALRAFARDRWFSGVYVWQWKADPGHDGGPDTDHSPEGKPALATLARLFGARR